MSAAVQADEALAWVLEKLAATDPAKLSPPKPFAFDPAKFTIKVPSPTSPLPAAATTAKKPDRKREMDMFHQWNNNGRKPEDLEPLLHSFQPLIQNRVNIYKNRVEIPTPIIEHKHNEAFVKALETFDPSKGAQLHTWVTRNLTQVNRYVGVRQNIARITDNVSRHIGSVNAVKAELSEKLGHEPSAQEIHDYIIEIDHPDIKKLSARDISRVIKEQRKTNIDKGHDNLPGRLNLGTKDEEIIHLIGPKLTPEERKVHELVFGLNGEKPHAPGEIAKRLGFHISKVSKLRKRIHNKMLPYLEEG
jgi:DNA-directed RNA polymerase specialized sigma subunit